MMKLVPAILLLIICNSSLSAAQNVSKKLAQKGEQLFSDQFERDDLGDWKVVIPGFRVSDGMLLGTQDREDHGSVGRIYLPMKNVVMTFRFKMAGSPNFNVVFDDKNHKGSHAGHICRVAIAKRQIRLGDDKEGTMRNDIFAMRRDPKQKANADELIKDRTVITKANLEADRWYALTIEIVDDKMQVSLDGEVVGLLQSPGLAHPTKQSVHFTVTGKEMHFDDVQIWKAKSK